VKNCGVGYRGIFYSKNRETETMYEDCESYDSIYEKENVEKTEGKY
jgi:hypothetical protein